MLKLRKLPKLVGIRQRINENKETKTLHSDIARNNCNSILVNKIKLNAKTLKWKKQMRMTLSDLFSKLTETCKYNYIHTMV